MTVRKEKSFESFASGSDITGANLKDLNPLIANWVDAGERPAQASYNYSEVLQGNINDCYFMAALSAVAWGSIAKLSNFSTYRFYKISTMNPVTVQTQDISLDGAAPEEVPVNSVNNPLFAQKPSGGDIWAMLYEKAYAKFMDPIQPSRPNYTFIDGGNGYRALINLTGYTSGGEYPATDSANTILSKLGLSITSSQAISNKAAVAWTKSQGMPESSLYASHTYSILGSYISGGKKYIVLRNPYGNQSGGSIVNPEPSTGVSTDSINLWNKSIYLNDTNDGIFAYDLEQFRLYFAKYGIAKP